MGQAKGDCYVSSPGACFCCIVKQLCIIRGYSFQAPFRHHKERALPALDIYQRLRYNIVC